MKAMPASASNERFEARRRVEIYCQTLVDTGAARWRINGHGDTELHLETGEAYSFGDLGITRLATGRTLKQPDLGFLH